MSHPEGEAYFCDVCEDDMKRCDAKSCPGAPHPDCPHQQAMEALEGTPIMRMREMVLENAQLAMDYKVRAEKAERELKALLAGEWIGDPNASTFPFPREGIVCFHCGKRFHTPGAARLHFGAKPNEPGTPKCTAVPADAYLQTR